jgi:hypothetical protein
MGKQKRKKRTFGGLSAGKRGHTKNDVYYTKLRKEMEEGEYPHDGAYGTTEHREPIRLMDDEAVAARRLRDAFMAGWYSHSNGGTDAEEDWAEYHEDQI